MIMLFLVLAVCLLLGIPVVFSIIIATLTFMAATGGSQLMLVAHYMVDGLNSFPLMALPLFTLSGAIMAYGSTPRIMALANMLLGKKQWGMGSVGVVGCCAFGTISGSGVATVSAIGSIIAPEMVKNGYKPGFTASILGAAGTLGAIIPPSVIFVVYAQVSNASIKDMFLAGVIPGCLAGWMLCVLNKRMVKRKGWCKQVVPAKLDRREKRKIILNAIPPLFMPVIILGGVLSGRFTPTEAAAVATVYAIILSTLVYRELNFRQFIQVCVDSAVNSAVVLIIMSAAQAFGYVITVNNIPQLIGQALLNTGGGIVLIYGLILLIMGTFMETVSIILLTTPIFLPVLSTLGVDPIAYGITCCLALCVGSVTPPLAVCLFTGCKILKIRVEDTFPEVIVVCGVMVLATILTAVFPILSTLLPTLFS